MSDFLETAIQAAREAGKILMKNYGKVPAGDIRKKETNDFISFVDEQSEKIILDIIFEKYPDHQILAEESGKKDNESEYTWIIDPLDGTTNYLHSIPVFAVSIALKKKTETIAGVVYNPLTNELFSAEKNNGAFLNDNPITVSKNATLKESFIATGFPFKPKHKLPEYLKAFENIFEECVGARRLGAAAIDLVYVACGRFDGFWEIGLKPWDMAAGEIIVKEAGGKITDFWGQNYYISNSYVIASNSLIHQQLKDKINEAFPFFKPISEGANN